MSRFLRQSTSIIVAVGPFVSSSNGLTVLSAVVLSATDRASLVKHNTSAAATNISGNTWSAIVSAEGHYALTLSTGNTDTVGAVRVIVNDASDSLPVYNDFYVLEEAIYDALFAASAAAFDANQDVTVGAHAAGSFTSAAWAASAIISAAISAGAITSTGIADGAITSAEIAAGAIISATFAAGAINAAALATDAIASAKISADAVTKIQVGLATSAAVTTIDDFLDTEIAAILALLDDPRGEPGQGAPPVNPDLATKIDYLYKFARNRVTQTSATFSIYADDATTVDHKATVGDDATTFDRGELATGP